MPAKAIRFFVVICTLTFVASFHTSAQSALGLFDNSVDVGHVLHQGNAVYNASKQQYELSGSGNNIWFNHDAFHFLCKKTKGNFILHARGGLIGKGVEAHRKFGWMIRSSLDSNAAMVGATIHGGGLTSLQDRNTAGINVEEMKITLTGPDVIQLERKDNQYIMSVAHDGDTLVAQQITGIDLGNEVYVGLFVCAHNNNVVEKASFDNVSITNPARPALVPYKEYLGSHLELMDVATGHRQTIYTVNYSIQAPNWLHNG